MDYKLLIRAHKLMKAEWEGYDYETSVDIISKTDDPRIKAMAGIFFLLSWNWMWFQDKLGKIDFSEILRNCVRLIKQAESLLKDEHLDSVNLDEIENEVKILFREFSKLFGSTGASKFLHILFPKLFVMWDSKIREMYDISPDENGYFEFLKEMQRIIKKTLEDFAKDKELDVERAREELIAICDGYNPTKVLDEYNYLKAWGRMR